VEHDNLLRINVAVPRSVGTTSRCVRDDQLSSSFRFDAPGLNRNWNFPVPTHAMASDSHLAMPLPLYGANCIFGSNVSRAPFTETNISGNAFAGTKIPATAHTGPMFPSASITGYPAFPGLTAGGSMQFPSAFSGHALNPPMNYGHLNHSLPIRPWLGYSTPFGSAFPLLGLLPPTNLFNSYPAPWSMPYIPILPFPSASAGEPEVTPSTSPEVNPPTSSCSSSSFHTKRKREVTAKADISNIRRRQEKNPKPRRRKSPASRRTIILSRLNSKSHRRPLKHRHFQQRWWIHRTHLQHWRRRITRSDRLHLEYQGLV